MTQDEFRRLTLSQWYIPPETKRFRSVTHPCPFQLTLAYNVVSMFSGLGQVVCDPNNGTGTTTLAAYCLSRPYIGIDLDPDFCEIAEGRIADAARLTPRERLDWIRSQLFVPEAGQRKDGWGRSDLDGSNFKRRLRHRMPTADE